MDKNYTRLKDTIGTWAFRALVNGRPLQIWRRSTPHNWFIEKYTPGEYLWHSGFGPNLDLSLFEKVHDSDSRLPNYFGSDSNHPELSLYMLKIPEDGSLDGYLSKKQTLS